jgi:serine/threonine-protein kinase
MSREESEMISIDGVRQQLIDSQLMTAEGADRHISRWREQTGASDDTPGDVLLDWLVQQTVLTEFQGDALKAGHTGPFMLGPYRVFERVAVGRLGNVYRAMHDELNQPVSLKVFPSSLKDDSEKVTRMEREFRATIELDHPNIVRSFQIGQVGDIYYLALQDLQGETLLERLNREGAMAYPTACKLILDVARALTHLHDEGLVHRDVSPANMWVTEGGNCMLMELGAVRDALGGFVSLPDEDQITTSETVIGTFEYMAPEQASDAHAADQRSDIYSLGCTFYHCLAGEKPFKEKNPVKLVMQHASKMPKPLTEVVSDVPNKLSETVNSMVAKSPNDRFQKAQDVIWAVEPYAEEPKVEPAEEQVASPEYLQWLRTAREEAKAARSPELAKFLAWLADEDSAES